MLTGKPLDVLILLLLAVVVIALVWLRSSTRARRDPADSVAQFSRALTALAPTGTVPDADPARPATSKAS